MLIYSLDQAPNEKKIIEQCARERRPLPDAIANAPDLWLGLDLFYMAFTDLTSCRSFSTGGPGPIPWSAIQIYCDAYEIKGEQREDVFYHVQHLDTAYLEWAAKKIGQKKDSAPTGRKQRGK